MNRINFLKWFARVSMALMAVAVGVILFWIFQPPTEAIAVSKVPIPITNTVISPNTFVTLKYSYCKQVSSIGRISITLVNQTSALMLPTGYEASNKGCYNNTTVVLPVPPQATGGVYHFHFRATYIVNPLRTITQDYDTVNFTVK